MINQDNELIIELWSRIKSHILPKERLEVADIFITVFDEFDKVDEGLLDEDLDKELRAAVMTLLGGPMEYDESEEHDYSDE